MPGARTFVVAFARVYSHDTFPRAKPQTTHARVRVLATSCMQNFFSEFFFYSPLLRLSPGRGGLPAPWLSRSAAKLGQSVMDRKLVREHGYSSRNYCAVPRQPKGSATTDPSQFNAIAAKAEENKLQLLVEHLEQQVRSALSARTTATKGDLRVLKDAFAKFDHDQSGNVDYAEFRLAMEHLGLHVEGQGLAGKGGLPAQAMELLFAKYDTDQSGTVSYEEFAAQVLAEDNYPHL